LSEIAEDGVRCERCGGEFVDGDACPLCGALRAEVPCDDGSGKPAHSRCVICARALCDPEPDPARPALCAEHCSIPVIEGWSQVYTTAVELEAQLIVENLLAEGIDAQLYSQRDRSFPVDLGELSIARVLVPVWEHQQAMEIIQERMDTEGEVLFACPSCGEAYEPGARDCAACGAPLAA
jgi:hypothetical protein